MNIPPMFADMLNLVKKNVETSFQSTALVQEQTERMAKWLLDQGTNLQGENRKFLEQWIANAKKQQADYQSSFQAQLEKLSQFVSKKE